MRCCVECKNIPCAPRSNYPCIQEELKTTVEEVYDGCMKATVTHTFTGCYSGCPYCTDNGTLSPEYCRHPSFDPPKKIVGYSSKSEIPMGKQHPDWCPCQ